MGCKISTFFAHIKIFMYFCAQNREIMSKRVLIGMSGGIDSTVAAILLLEQGYELVGATFRTFDPKSVADAPGYIREYGRLFRCYAVPCMLSGLFMPFSAVFSLIILLLWGIFGTWWLIHSYKKMEKQYIL